MLNVQNITIEKGDQSILKDVSGDFDFQKTYQIIGKEGAGKTSLFEALCGADKPSNGDVSIRGTSLYDSSFMELSLLRKKLGVVFDIPALISNQSILENIKLALECRHLNEQEELCDSIEEYLEIFNLQDKKDLRPACLSQCEKKIVSFIRAIIAKPEFLIFDAFDEFILGDYVQQKLNLIDRLRKQAVGGIFFTKRNLENLMNFNQVVLLENGAVIYE